MWSWTGAAENTLSNDFQFSSAATNTSGQLVAISTVKPSGWKAAFNGRLKWHPMGSGRTPDTSGTYAKSEEPTELSTILSSVGSAIVFFSPVRRLSTDGRAGIKCSRVRKEQRTHTS